MSLLWVQAVLGPERETPVKSAGFAGYVDYDEPTRAAYDKNYRKGDPERTPDHEDNDLGDFFANHARNTKLWKKKGTFGQIPLHTPVFATQSHVSQAHIDRYVQNPGAATHQRATNGASWSNDYPGDKAPVFVTHEGRLHVLDGHHRIAAAIQRGDDSITGYHYDADKHGFPFNEW